jgi:DNA-binding SARP family transcriptional activator
VELGRLTRAESLLTSFVGRGNSLLDAAYTPTLGLIAAARGDYARAIALITDGRRSASEYGDDAAINACLLYESVILRAKGQHDLALEPAERSFEAFGMRDYFHNSRLAAIEVGASMAAMGDSATARNWIDLAEAIDSLNLYYALCGAMVLAVADHRDGDIESAVSRLTPLADYIRSDSANWRMAMYCRTFPELLGLLARAVGVHTLPVHMLRMLLPENAERSLKAAMSLLSAEDWRTLGSRCLGEEQFDAFVDRKGKPICRVRLFGGLDVSVDHRSIRERDWKKRKSRLLFAMLVVRRGQDVPRDEILEYLWPDLDYDKAKNNFYVAWSTMKAALMAPDHKQEPCPYIESRRGRCRVICDLLRSDVDEFEELIAEIREHEAAGKVTEAVNALQNLMSVYRGDLLPGDVYDDWFASCRDKYRFEFVDAMLRGVELLLEQDDPCEALVLARRGLAVDPYREDLYQAALRCHIIAGQRSAAIETFIQCKTQLAEQLGLDPGADTMALYQEILVMEERPRQDNYGLTKS